MTWATTKVFVKKAWVWLKHHWYVPALLIYTIATWIFFRARTQNVLKMFEISKEAYKKEIDAINSAHAKELKDKEKLYATYLNTLKNIEKEHKVNFDSLTEEKKFKLDEMVKEYEGAPEDLAEEIKKLFGI